jgi:hypothetical protein
LFLIENEHVVVVPGCTPVAENPMLGEEASVVVNSTDSEVVNVPVPLSLKVPSVSPDALQRADLFVVPDPESNVLEDVGNVIVTFPPLAPALSVAVFAPSRT